MRNKRVLLGILFLVIVRCLHGQSHVTQSESQPYSLQANSSVNEKYDRCVLTKFDDIGFHQVATVCFATCKYKGDSRTYIGVADKDDENCTAACGKASAKCKDSNDTNCSFVADSCKYTNCP